MIDSDDCDVSRIDFEKRPRESRMEVHDQDHCRCHNDIHRTVSSLPVVDRNCSGR